MPNYRKNPKALNNNELYKEVLEERGLENGVVQYKTKLIGEDFKNVSVQSERHVWSMGDRFYKLSYQYYGTYEFWWVIAMFNAKPTEAHCNYGDPIYIPLNPLELVSEV